MVEACNWITKYELIGHYVEWTHLCNNLQNNSHGVFSVWGIAGVGKSALVRSIYYNNMMGINQNYPGKTTQYRRNLQEITKHSWVDVPHPFSLTDLSRHLLLDFHSDDLEAKEREAVGLMEGQDSIQRCRKFMREDKCFVVIDGHRSTDDWDFIEDAFLSKPIQGCIIVITHDENVATHCADKKDQVINVKGLEADAANDLTKIACGSKQFTSDEDELSSLTTKCGGLPKVITAIGDYCSAFYTPFACLKNINADFMGMLETDQKFHCLKGLFSWMRSYFHDCPDSLKPCIFYLSIFPLGHNIRRKRLLRRWIAEGYSRDTPGSTAEENGEMFFAELVKLSIIQQEQSPSKADVCKVNGFFREYIISRPMQDNLVFALERHCSLNSQRAGQHLTISSSWDRAKILLESMELSRLRSFTVFGKWRSFFISADVKMKLLRVLDLEDTLGVTDSDLEQIGELLPHLKYLSLRGCNDITRLPSSLGALRQLQTLDIKGTSIVTLPPAVMKLDKLQYVRAGTTHCISTTSEDNNGIVACVGTPPAADGDGASTSQTPAAAPPRPPTDGDDASTNQAPPPAVAAAAADDESRASISWNCRPRGGLVFSLLSKLRRHGLVSCPHDGVQFPAAAVDGIGKLTALHTLGVVNVRGAGGKAVLRELKKLGQLRKLKLFGINRKNWEDFCHTISDHGYLESLSVRLDKDEQQDHLCCLDDISNPPKTLKTLKLYGGNVYVSRIWMKQLDGLENAQFEDLELTISTQEDIDSLMEVPCNDKFRRICVKPSQDGQLLHYGVYDPHWNNEPGFTNAQVLKIDCGSYKLIIEFGKWPAFSVNVLEIHCSTTEASLEVSGLVELRSLKEVWLKGSYSEAVKQNLQQKLDELYSLHLQSAVEYGYESEYRRIVLKLEEQPRPCSFISFSSLLMCM